MDDALLELDDVFIAICSDVGPESAELARVIAVSLLRVLCAFRSDRQLVEQVPKRWFLNLKPRSEIKIKEVDES